MARQDQTVRINVEASGIEKFERQVEQLYQRLQRKGREAGMARSEMGGYIDRALRNQDQIAENDLRNQRENLRRSIAEGQITRTKANQLWEQSQQKYEQETAIRREVRKRNIEDTDRRAAEREFNLDESTRSSWREVRHKAKNWEGVDRQIKTIERERAAEIKKEDTRIDRAEKKGEITSKEADRLRKENRDDESFNREMLARLREIAKNTKDSAKKEGEELAKRLNIQNKEQADRAVHSLLRPTGDIAKDSRRKAAAEYIKERDYSQKDGFLDIFQGGGGLGSLMQGGKGGLGSLMQGGGLLGGLLRGGGGLGSVMRMVGRLGPIAAILGLAAYGVGNYTSRWKKARDVALPANVEAEPIMDLVREGRPMFSRLGLNDDDVYRVMGSQQQAAGKILSGRDVTQNIIRSRLANVDEGTFNNLLRLSRYSTGDAAGISTQAARITKNRYGTPLRVDEVLDTFQQLAQSQLAVSGRVNSGAILGTTANIMNRTGASGQQLTRIVESLQGIGQNQSPGVKALIQKAASQYLGPNASMWDIQKLIEDPMSNPQFINFYLKQLEAAGGTGDMAKFSLKNALNLSYNDTEKLYDAYEKNQNLATVLNPSSSPKDDEDFVEEYDKYVSWDEKIGSLWKGFVNEAVDAAAERGAAAAEKMYQDGQDALNKIADAQDKIVNGGTWWDKLQGYLEAMTAGINAINSNNPATAFATADLSIKNASVDEKEYKDVE